MAKKEKDIEKAAAETVEAIQDAQAPAGGFGDPGAPRRKLNAKGDPIEEENA